VEHSFDFQDFIISQKVIFFKTKFSPKNFRGPLGAPPEEKLSQKWHKTFSNHILGKV